MLLCRVSPSAFEQAARHRPTLESRMNARAIDRMCWTTSAFAAAADTSAIEVSALRNHIDHCNCSRGRYFAAGCVVDAVHAFVAPRLVTTLVIAFAVFGLGALALT
jgi:hypothetical protein